MFLRSFFLIFGLYCYSSVAEASIYYLHESTAIICTLIEAKQLSSILEETSEEGLTLLINNYSPASMAMEAEVFNCTLPVILCFYKKSDDSHQEMFALFSECADHYNNQIKFIAVDVEQLPAIAQAFQVEQTPALSSMIKRHEIEFIETELSRDIFYASAEKLLHTARQHNGA